MLADVCAKAVPEPTVDRNKQRPAIVVPTASYADPVAIYYHIEGTTFATIQRCAYLLRVPVSCFVGYTSRRPPSRARLVVIETSSRPSLVGGSRHYMPLASQVISQESGLSTVCFSAQSTRMTTVQHTPKYSPSGWTWLDSPAEASSNCYVYCTPFDATTPRTVYILALLFAGEKAPTKP